MNRLNSVKIFFIRKFSNLLTTKFSFKLTTLFVIISLFFIISTASHAAKPHFPPQLTAHGKSLKPDQRVDNEKEIQSTIKKFKYVDRGREVDAIALYPKDNNGGNIPGILFLHTEDEIPAGQLKKMDEIAKKGYIVMTSLWKDKDGAEEAFKQFLKLDGLDVNLIGAMGAHDGGTEALRLACNEKNNIKAVVSVTGKPPYDVPGGEPADYITSPVFLIHGMADTQLPISVSQYFYETLNLKARKVKTFFLLNSRHYFDDMEWSQIMSEAASFFDGYLKNI